MCVGWGGVWGCEDRKRQGSKDRVKRVRAIEEESRERERESWRWIDRGSELVES